MSDRASILDILYAEVIDASRLADDTKSGPPQIHREAMEALQKAVERYTDYSLDGHIPDDLEGKINPLAEGSGWPADLDIVRSLTVAFW